jgi:hypothetical protein
METSSQRLRRSLVLGAAAVMTAATIVVGATALAGATPTSAQLGTVRGPGYPPPKGIYKPFVNCPLNNPMMHEVMPITDNGGGFAACTAGDATSGSVTIGNITTTITEPVSVQFGFFIPPKDANGYPAPAVPPLAGTSAILTTKPDLIPDSLTTALGCPSTDPTVEHICRVAQSRGGVYNKVYALAQEAGQISGFDLLSWTQPVKFRLVNPLLGNSCYIGSDEMPVVLNPALSVSSTGGLSEEPDPNPTVHPDSDVLVVSGAIASDTTFSAPGVIGCGPGGSADVPIDEAIDTSAGLPAASGTNSISLDGTFYIAVNTASEDSTLTQPQDDASNLLAAFKASTNGEHSVKHLTMAQAKAMFGLRG